MQFAPGAPFILAVGANFPLAFAEDFQAAGIEDEMLDLFRMGAKFDLKPGGTPREDRIMRSR